MAVRTPNIEQAQVAIQRIEPFLGRYSSAWCRQLLYSTLHHTSRAFDQFALRTQPLCTWFNTEAWPFQERRDIYETETVHWCEECLKLGYHCFGHQLVGLDRCPLHDTPMRCGCPKCEFALPMRSHFSLECSEPLRNCIHCHQPILSVAASFKWPKSVKFLQFERDSLRRYVYWAKQVNRLRYRLVHHSEGPFVVAQTHLPSQEQTRLAIEAVCPLPRGIVTAPQRSRLMVTLVVLDARLVRKAVVPSRIQSALVRVMLRHLGRKPLPAAWERHWRTFEVETPTPANAGESSHFSYWRELLITKNGGFKPSGPIESLRPCMLPLMAARLVGQFSDLARPVRYSGGHDLAVSFFFSNSAVTIPADPLGDLPGIIVELHNGCDEVIFRQSDDVDAG